MYAPLIALVICSPLFVLGFLFLRELKRESDGYSRMARKMREIRDWERENAPGEPSALRSFRDVFK